ncbi:Putative major facilitator superfamily, MFS transporter superfamily [Septoria linicola]|uniref:Major facilitator superfamily, MFS transporter superfamily n=1 Tax=Septoria linicola TaxID=215465 RepID=A0A9Q9AR47_9PEZI|nr:Putative major facilitator superfamily, MFS transporter superfamily [Septoria linicola]
MDKTSLSESKSSSQQQDGIISPPGKNTETTNRPQDVSKVIKFHPSDPENPRNWPLWRKRLAWIPIIPLDLLVSFGASGYSPATEPFTETWGVSTTIGVLGLSLYTLALGIGPLFNGPASEYFGRKWIYIISYGLALPFFVSSALAPNLACFFISRFLCGFFQSVTVATLGGTIAALYVHHETGYAMSIYLWAATGGSSMGYMMMAFVAQYRSWVEVFCALLGISGGYYLLLIPMILYVGETRHSVILRKRAAKIRKETGDESINVAEEHRRKGFWEILKVTQTRPFRFLFAEPVVQFCALYNGYLYGISFLFNGAFNLVFGKMGHGLDVLQVGLCFLGILGGITIGPISNIFQEKFYQRRRLQADGKNIPEARLRMGQIAGVTFPIALFWSAWTTYTSIHPAVPVVASALWGWSFYTLILMTYQYTEDAYKQYSASALAGLGLIRNVAGGGFPLFGNQMFENLGYQWAASVLAFLALVMIPIPFVLSRYGERLRRRSP